MKQVWFLLILLLTTSCSKSMEEKEEPTAEVKNGWQKTEEIDFSFGQQPGKEPPEGNPSLPASGGVLWQGHLVATIDTTTIGIELLLLSLQEWTEVSGSKHEQTPDMATRLASSYTEQALGDWRIPTREEAKAMRRNLGDEQLATTNALLQANNLITLSGNEVTDAQGNATRYLCDDAAYSFTWNGSNISQTGSKRGYHLRLVKKIMASP